MPTPKITGLLHNCALNCALPFLLDGIRQLAEREGTGTLGDLESNTIYQRYKQLKTVFARHYGFIDKSNFNWQQFHNFLNAHSFYAKEIIFAPIFRSFIAEVGEAQGSYRAEDVGLLRDIGEDGRYNYLPDSEARDLLYDTFGISLQTFEYVSNRGTENPQDNYNLVTTKLTTNTAYPFGTTPTLKLYLKDEHFELQPHESLMEANAAFIAEINALPAALVIIHDGLSTSDSAHHSNTFLARLVVYVNQELSRQLAPAASTVVHASVENAGESLATARERGAGALLSPSSLSPRSHRSDEDGENVAAGVLIAATAAPLPSLPGSGIGGESQFAAPTTRESKFRREAESRQQYLLDARNYAVTGLSHHSKTPAGRHTFAVILLTILMEAQSKKAEEICSQLNKLARDAQADVPLAAYFLDKLALAIIDSKADVDAKKVQRVMTEIQQNQERHAQIKNILDPRKRKREHAKLVVKALKAVKHAWQLYKDTHDANLITVIQETQKIALEPSRVNIEGYSRLRERVDGKGSWGKIIGGLMLAVIGAALIAVAVVGALATFGGAIPLSYVTAGIGFGAFVGGAMSVTAGLRFFKDGKNKGLYLELKEVEDDAQQLRPS